jgi:hypothetical protein
MNKALRVCALCGKPIYEEKYFVNCDVDDGLSYHKSCLKETDHEENSIGYMKKRTKAYMPIYYTKEELVEIVIDLFRMGIGKYIP